MKEEILKLLRGTQGYVSGQEICSRLGVSRTAVWKAINQLKEDGYQIDAVQNRGYRLNLNQMPDVLSTAELASRMQTEWAGRRVYYEKTVDSTNNWAKRLADGAGDLPHGALAVAEQQTAGKGRRGRQWDSPAGQAVFMSLILKPDMLPASASMLTLVAALAVNRGILKACGLPTLIKWPNDIVANGKKVCGILTEMSTELDYINYVVAGIGINVNNRQFPPDLADKASSLLLETGREHNRASLICAVMEAFEGLYGELIKTGDLSRLRDEYNQSMVNLDRQVRVLSPGREFEGTARGITAGGELMVEREDGTAALISSGEVSVRGIYGYV